MWKILSHTSVAVTLLFRFWRFGLAHLEDTLLYLKRFFLPLTSTFEFSHHFIIFLFPFVFCELNFKYHLQVHYLIGIIGACACLCVCERGGELMWAKTVENENCERVKGSNTAIQDLFNRKKMIRLIATAGRLRYGSDDEVRHENERRIA